MEYVRIGFIVTFWYADLFNNVLRRVHLRSGNFVIRCIILFFIMFLGSVRTFYAERIHLAYIGTPTARNIHLIMQLFIMFVKTLYAEYLASEVKGH